MYLDLGQIEHRRLDMRKLKVDSGVDFESLIDRIENDGELVTLLDKDGLPIAIIMPFEDYEDLKANDSRGQE